MASRANGSKKSVARWQHWCLNSTPGAWSRNIRGGVTSQNSRFLVIVTLLLIPRPRARTRRERLRSKASVSPDIKSQTKEELDACFAEWAVPPYRVDQLLHWLYVQHVTSWEAMTNLPKHLREKLSEYYSLHSLELVCQQGARDMTQKFLWRLDDHALVESVLIPATPALHGDASDRRTLCVSTQVGCAYGCKFCASGLEGWKRNLRGEEVVEQVLAVERWHKQSAECGMRSAECGVGSAEVSRSEIPRLIDNLVIMGMGEPLANYDNLLKALRILNAPWGGGIGARKITISTSGLAPQIRKLADEPLQFPLAISLHGATDETRNKIMPINRRYPLRELTAACEYYQRRRERMITFELLLISGVNDSPAEVKPLA